MASRFELAYGPRFDLDEIARVAPAPALAAIFEVIGFLLENPFPGQSAVEVMPYKDQYCATFQYGLLVYRVEGRTVTLTSVVLA